MPRQSTHQHGIPCPECSFFIPTTMPMLLSGEPIVCPMCGLALHVDAEKSADSLKLVNQLHEATQKVEQTRRQFR
ncbi:hypothetical protein [Okeania sp. SIO1F9]|uniref:hypothetical protein n=1 Tax=Okeania sp. SIO1F9 TaxID=2607813 RepID=UPI00144FEEDB|nr:hypothetical protein [Okeania sp. SIO1F9]NET76244.1 hypothetical protein [Okeania sp. SIO1F9]